MSAAKLYRARQKGSPVKLESTGGLADGLQARRLAVSHFGIIRRTSTMSFWSMTRRFRRRCSICSTE